MNEPKEITVRLVECRCDSPKTILHLVKTKYGTTFIQLKCDGCGCASPLKSKVIPAIKEWNGHFGKSAKKHDATWTMDGIWEQFL